MEAESYFFLKFKLNLVAGNQEKKEGPSSITWSLAWKCYLSSLINSGLRAGGWGTGQWQKWWFLQAEPWVLPQQTFVLRTWVSEIWGWSCGHLISKASLEPRLLLQDPRGLLFALFPKLLLHPWRQRKGWGRWQSENHTDGLSKCSTSI